MRGKLIFSAVALSLSAAAFASGAMPAPAPINYFDGFYAGIGLGVSHLSADVDVKTKFAGGFYHENDKDFDHPLAVFGADTGSSIDMGDSAVAGDLFVGYGKTFYPEGMENGLYAGIEIYGRYENHNPEASFYAHAVGGEPVHHLGDGKNNGWANLYGKTDIETKWFVGAALKGGYLVTPKTMIYILLGAQYAKFETEARGNLDAGVNLDPKLGDAKPIGGALAYGYTFDEKKWAFVPGLGFETMVSDNWSLRGEYTYAIYSNVSDNRSTGRLVAPIDVKGPHDYAVAVTGNSDVSYKPRIGTFVLGLTYRANGV